jgi:flagellar biosynthetic protein FliR
MSTALFDIFSSLPVFALVLFRVGGFMMTAPVFAARVMPVRIRAALAMTAALAVFPLVRRQAPADLTLSAALIGGLGEVMIGAAIGLSLAILIAAAEIAGQLVGHQAGLSLGEVVNPAFNEPSMVLAQLYAVVFTVLLLMLGGHREALAALLDTYRATPLLAAESTHSWLLLMIEMLTAALTTGLRLAGPVLLALFLTTIVLGVLSRAIPQLHILAVGFTLKTLVTMGVAALSLAWAAQPLNDAVWEALKAIRSAMGLESSDAGAMT